MLFINSVAPTGLSSGSGSQQDEQEVRATMGGEPNFDLNGPSKWDKWDFPEHIEGGEWVSILAPTSGANTGRNSAPA